MQRRSFLKTIAGGLLATKLAFDLGAKAVEITPKGFVNPMWVDAPYETTYIFWNCDTGMRFEYLNGEYIPITYTPIT